MLQEPETPVIDLELVSCGTCDTVFISSARRQTCPACGGEAIGPYLEFIVTPEGPRLKNGAIAIVGAPTDRLEPVAEPAALAAEEEVVEEEAGGGLETITTPELFPVAVASFLERGAGTEDDLRGMLTDMGADPETAATTVGRLAAVRDTVASLTTAHPELVEGRAAEELAAPAPDPEAAEGDGSEA